MSVLLPVCPYLSVSVRLVWSLAHLQARTSLFTAVSDQRVPQGKAGLREGSQHTLHFFSLCGLCVCVCVGGEGGGVHTVTAVSQPVVKSAAPQIQTEPII